MNFEDLKRKEKIKCKYHTRAVTKAGVLLDEMDTIEVEKVKNKDELSLPIFSLFMRFRELVNTFFSLIRTFSLLFSLFLLDKEY